MVAIDADQPLGEDAHAYYDTLVDRLDPDRRFYAAPYTDDQLHASLARLDELLLEEGDLPRRVREAAAQEADLLLQELHLLERGAELLGSGLPQKGEVRAREDAEERAERRDGGRLRQHAFAFQARLQIAE